jgi:hypothetical protein
MPWRGHRRLCCCSVICSALLHFCIMLWSCAVAVSMPLCLLHAGECHSMQTQSVMDSEGICNAGPGERFASVTAA